VPTISRFFGIVIRMYYDDHAPPHFHAYYGDDVAVIAINTLEVIEGDLPKRPFGTGGELGAATPRRTARGLAPCGNAPGAEADSPASLSLR
jgi:hypothetical protein